MRVFKAPGQGGMMVTRLRFTPDGSTVTASLPQANHLVNWDIASGRAWCTKALAGTRVTCFAYSPDGEVLAVGGSDGIVRPYSLPDFRTDTSFEAGYQGGHYAYAVAFAPALDPRDQWLATGGTGLCLWNRVTHELIRTGGNDPLPCVEFSPDGSTVFACNDLLHLDSWHARPLGQKGRVLSAEPSILQFALGPDGQTVALVVGSDIELRTLDDRPLFRLPVPALHQPRDLAFTPDGRCLFVASGSFTVLAFDPHTGQLIREYDWEIGKISSVAVSPDGTMAAAGSERGQVVVWDLDG